MCSRTYCAWPLSRLLGTILFGCGFTYLLLTPNPYDTAGFLESFRPWLQRGAAAHLLGYLGWSIALASTLAGWGKRAVVAGMAALVLHACLTEAAQLWIPPRTCQPEDLACNFAGIAVGMLLWTTSQAFRPAQVAEPTLLTGRS